MVHQRGESSNRILEFIVALKDLSAFINPPYL